jgi:hypothetical protein
VDPDWGAAFWKTTAYAPYPIWVWLNGHLSCYYRSSRLKQYLELRHEVVRCEWTRRQEGRLMSVA